MFYKFFIKILKFFKNSFETFPIFNVFTREFDVLMK